MAASDILAGSAAESAKKSMTCALENDPKQPTLAIFMCILAGGEQLIPNGTLATVRYRLANNLPPGPAQIGVDGALAVTADGKQKTLPVSGGVITIQ